MPPLARQSFALLGVKLVTPVAFAASLVLAATAIASQKPKPAAPSNATSASQALGLLFIQEFRVEGAKLLARVEIEEAVYPFLGPDRSAADVESARAALEKLYRSRGFETVTVQIPPQDPAEGVVVIEVTETKVGRLRVRGSRYYSLSGIKGQAPSLAEGTTTDFAAVTHDIVGLNQLPDRRVTPSVRPGREPGTVDVDLTVVDKLPLHASIELNNRYSSGTTPLRLNAAVRYDNLWQLGHSIGASYQVAPERPDDARVFSAFYTLRLPAAPGLSFTLQGTKQDSDVSTLGGGAVAGRGYLVGLRANLNLPPGKGFFHAISLGLDYKNFDQDIRIADGKLSSPIRYVPFTASYNGGFEGKGWSTDFSVAATVLVRGWTSGEASFETKRFRASASSAYLRAELAHTREIGRGFQVYGRVQGQIASGPLVDNEEFAGGGLSSVRGYLESSALGDNAFFGTVELRTPSFASYLPSGWIKEARLFAFAEGGGLSVYDALPQQTARFYLGSLGGGARVRILESFFAALDVGVPLTAQGATRRYHPLLTFRVSAEL